LNAEPPVPVRRVHDLELFLNKLAVVRPVEMGGAAPAVRASSGEGVAPPVLAVKHHVMTFAPDGARGVAAYLDGEKAASA
jgi:hypothetical protein